MRTEKSCLLNSCLLEASIKSPLSGVINTQFIFFSTGQLNFHTTRISVRGSSPL
ncbi:BnaCnng27670D [Brassica napus]|uniref:(rape) hypothetical protein n=1 Tax=Brassica napus TaxID=3708 RepID=A0A078IXJ4_BRANA|nr:unnamed protein product [Brassica napus]CDY54936.1 BnaCnng27670D [Brassica napus]